MGVYIKSMEMPTSCTECPIGDSIRCALLPGVPAWFAEYDQCVKEKRLHSHCPLVPVPPHGDLKDADEADEYAYDVLEICSAGAYETPWEAAREMQRIYRDMPTIIPAEEGE